MVPFRPWRWLRCRRFFRIMWQEGMDNQPDVNIQIPIRKGVVGECFRTGKPAAADQAMLKDTKLFPFPNRLRKTVGDLTAVVAYPIYRPKDSQGHQPDRRIGVLSLDSEAPDAFARLRTEPLLEEVPKHMKRLTAIASRLIF
jgi:hypothetical protein